MYKRLSGKKGQPFLILRNNKNFKLSMKYEQ
jgi:hypothetical protein